MRVAWGWGVVVKARGCWVEGMGFRRAGRMRWGRVLGGVETRGVRRWRRGVGRRREEAIANWGAEGFVVDGWVEMVVDRDSEGVEVALASISGDPSRFCISTIGDRGKLFSYKKFSVEITKNKVK